MSLRIVFAGTPAFAVPCLHAVAACGEIVGVYTQPDRPAGRGRQLLASPVKQAAQELGLPVFQPDNFKLDADRETLRALKPDLMVVVAYGLILSSKVLSIPKHGCWNVHASLLPRWRGAAPIQRAIEAGDAETGVCLMQMEKGLDTGPVFLSRSTPITAEDTGGSLHDRLSLLGADVLRQGLQLLINNQLPVAKPQSETGVLYAHKLEKNEAALDFHQSAAQLANKVRAFHPWPVCEAQIAGERLRIHAAIAIGDETYSNTGDVLAADKNGIDIACSRGVLRVTQLQREGGKVISAADYLNAKPQLRSA
jgi:methionyl-tRNA formyltransferase